MCKCKKVLERQSLMEAYVGTIYESKKILWNRNTPELRKTFDSLNTVSFLKVSNVFSHSCHLAPIPRIPPLHFPINLLNDQLLLDQWEKIIVENKRWR